MWLSVFVICIEASNILNSKKEWELVKSTIQERRWWIQKKFNFSQKVFLSIQRNINEAKKLNLSQRKKNDESLNLYNGWKRPKYTISAMPLSIIIRNNTKPCLSSIVIRNLASLWSAESYPTSSTQGPPMLRKSKNLIGKKREGAWRFKIREEPKGMNSPTV